MYRPGDLTLVDVHAPLADVARPSLGLLAAVQVEEVDVGGLVRHLEVADGAVALETKGNTRSRGENAEGEGEREGSYLVFTKRGGTYSKHFRARCCSTSLDHMGVGAVSTHRQSRLQPPF